MTKLLTEQELYTRLLKGQIIGTIPYANYLATSYAKEIEQKEFSDETKYKIFEEIINFYGDMLESDAERDLEKIMINANKSKAAERLKQLDVEYMDYFLEIISPKRTNVETFYNEISDRTNIEIKDEDITNIKISESTQNFNLAVQAWRNIVVNDLLAIFEIKQKTKEKINRIIYLNVSSKINLDADIEVIIDKSVVALKKKLTMMPGTKGYFEFRPNEKNDFLKYSIVSLFITICGKRGLDVIRKRFTHIKRMEYELHGKIFIIEIEDSDEIELKKQKMEAAIKRLTKICLEIIQGRYFGGLEGKVLTTNELSEKTGYDSGYINNKHKRCLSEMKAYLTELAYYN